MTDAPATVNWSTIDLSSLTLIVGWRRGKTIEVRRVDTTEEVADELGSACRSAIERLNSLEQKRWTPEAASEAEEYLFVPSDSLDENSAIIEALRQSPINQISAQDVPDLNLLFYAMAVGKPDRRVFFIRKHNPRRGISKRLITFFRNRLEKIDDPLFVFDYEVDLVLDPDAGLAILSLGVYNLFFKNAPEALEMIPGKVQSIAAALPMTETSMKYLGDRATTDTRVRRRLESIVSRDHLRNVTIDSLREYIADQGFNPDDYITDNELDIEKADVANVLKILNEDLFTGGLTGESFEASRKSARA